MNLLFQVAISVALCIAVCIPDVLPQNLSEFNSAGKVLHRFNKSYLVCKSRLSSEMTGRSFACLTDTLTKSDLLFAQSSLLSSV